MHAVETFLHSASRSHPGAVTARTREIRTGNSKVLITSRQADILRLLALNVNKTVSRDTLLDAVWGTASYANSLALNVQMSYLRRSLKNDPSVRIESLMKKGYMLAVL